MWKSILVDPILGGGGGGHQYGPIGRGIPIAPRRSEFHQFISKHIKKYMTFWPQICIKISYKLPVIFNFGVFFHRLCLTKNRNIYEIICNSLVKKSYVLLSVFHFSNKKSYLELQKNYKKNMEKHHPLDYTAPLPNAVVLHWPSNEHPAWASAQFFAVS